MLDGYLSPSATRLRFGKAVAAGVAGVLLTLLVAGCGGGASNGSSSPSGSGSSSGAATSSSGSSSGSFTVKAAKTKLGTVLVNSAGMTLYRYTADKKDKSGCTWSGCTALWPPLAAQGTPKGGPGVTGKLGVMTGPNGKQQVTYDGWPLYTYAVDRKAGQTAGQGVKDQKGIWYVVFASPSKNPAPPA